MARYERRFAKHEVESWKFIHGNFLPYQTLSDLGAPETIRNHFRLLLKFMRRLDFFSGWNSSPTLARQKSMLEKFSSYFGRMNGSRKADGSFKIWITQFKVIVVYVVNYKYQQKRSLRGFRVKNADKLGWIAAALTWKSLETAAKTSAVSFHPGKRQNNSDWWIISPLCLRFFASTVLRVSFWKALFLISTVNFCHPNPSTR